MADEPAVVEKEAYIPIDIGAKVIETELKGYPALSDNAVEKQHSGQAEPDPDGDRGFPVNKIASPSFNMSLWAGMPQVSTRLGQCIRIYSKNTVGLGWEIQSAIQLGTNAPDELKKRFTVEKVQLHELLFRPNNKYPFDDMMVMAESDKLGVGNGYIEVVRDPSGNIIELYHAKGTTIRVLKNQEGYVQVRGKNTVYFKNFGDERQMNKETGDFGSPSVKLRATELIHFKEYNVTDDFYGVPRWQSTVTAILGTRSAAERNLAFFDNDAVPRMAILASGGKFTPESLDMIQSFFAKGKGTKNAHRCLILQIDTDSSVFASQAKPILDLKPLTIGETDDASFQKYRNANDEEIRESFGIARAFFNPDDVNKAVAFATKAITNEQEFDPSAKSIEHVFYHTIISDMFSKEVKLKNDPAVIVDEVGASKRYMSKEKAERIAKDHFGGMFTSSALPEDIVMCEKESYVIAMLVGTGMYDYLRKETDPDSDSANAEYIVFKSKPLVKLVFNRPKLIDEAGKAEVHKIYLEDGALTPNEVRDDLGLEPYPDKLDFGDTPLPVYEQQGAIKTEGILGRGGKIVEDEEEEPDENDESPDNEDDNDE